MLDIFKKKKKILLLLLYYVGSKRQTTTHILVAAQLAGSDLKRTSERDPFVFFSQNGSNNHSTARVLERTAFIFRSLPPRDPASDIIAVRQ
jgi:hypothetical protein